MDMYTAVASGAIAMGYAVAGLFFLRFWRRSGDRLFALFATAFFVLCLNRLWIVYGGFPDEKGGYVYWVRFAAFALILTAVIDKNWGNRGRGYPVTTGAGRDRATG